MPYATLDDKIQLHGALVVQHLDKGLKGVGLMMMEGAIEQAEIGIHEVRNE